MAAWEEQEKQGSASFQIVLKRRDFFNATSQDLIHNVDRDLHFFQVLFFPFFYIFFTSSFFLFLISFLGVA